MRIQPMTAAMLERVHTLFGDCLTAPETLPFEINVFEKGEFVCAPRRELERLHFIVSGRLRIYATDDSGAEFFVSDAVVPGFLGDVEFTENAPSGEFVEAVSHVVSAALPLALCRARLEEDLLFHKFLCRSLSEKMAHVVDDQRRSASQPLTARIASYIAVTGRDEKPFRSLGVLSDNMHCSYRHAARTVQELCNRGALAKGQTRGTYVIQNRQLLEEIAGNAAGRF